MTNSEKELVKTLIEEATIHTDDIPLLMGMNRRYCVVRHEGDMCIMEKTTDHEDNIVHNPFSERAFGLRHRGEMVRVLHYTKNGPAYCPKSLASFWLGWKHRSIKDSTVFDPRGSKSKYAKRFYNLWPGYAITPEKGDCSLIIAHLRDIWCNGNEEQFTYLITWFAHMFQYPWEKPNVALVVKGGKAAGKSTVFDGILLPILGTLYSKMTHQEQLVGKFNRHTLYKLLLVAEEAFWAGDKSAEGPLKAMITDKPLQAEPKGVDAFDTYTYYRIAFVSNETRVVPATKDERRFFAIRVSSDKMRDVGYFNALWKQIENGGVAAFMDYLMTWEVDRNLVFSPPRTDVLTEDILENLSAFERWAFEFLHADEDDDLIEWDAPVTTFDIYDHYKRWLKEAKELGVYVSRAEIGTQTRMTQEFKRLFGFTLAKAGGKRCFILPSREAARKVFQDKVNAKIVWRDMVVEEEGFFDETPAKPEHRGFGDLDELLED
ncbi:MULTISPECIES: DUF5906 domain-containing protein [Pseudodesulfovibrio]|nr:MULTISPECIES: DUF5906 domain-containing protein [Pseudodesulfovibrio]MBU4380377.1 hypothetical protein [Pseudomonadota bacterium]MBV1763722.1 hypothetical protein [Pseudodesulfovibrio sp.]MCG2734399.1 DUF5906 domain-containing protein [Pseudodesulfovibrio aespoeensis]